MTSLWKRMLRGFALSMLAAATGCQAVYNEFDETIIACHNHWDAKMAWHRWYSMQECDPACVLDYKKGFIAGYEHMMNGGDGCRPTLPPRCYWSCMCRGQDSHCRVMSWFEGWSIGAEQALYDGACNVNEVLCNPESCGVGCNNNGYGHPGHLEGQPGVDHQGMPLLPGQLPGDVHGIPIDGLLQESQPVGPLPEPVPVKTESGVEPGAEPGPESGAEPEAKPDAVPVPESVDVSQESTHEQPIFEADEFPLAPPGDSAVDATEDLSPLGPLEPTEVSLQPADPDPFPDAGLPKQSVVFAPNPNDEGVVAIRGRTANEDGVVRIKKSRIKAISAEVTDPGPSLDSPAVEAHQPTPLNESFLPPLPPAE